MSFPSPTAAVEAPGVVVTRDAFGTVITYQNGDPGAQEAMRARLDHLCKGAVFPKSKPYDKRPIGEQLADIDKAFADAQMRGRV
jgi:hypothetical protein